MRVLYLFFLIVCATTLPGQSSLIEGKVVCQEGQPLYLALVYNAELSIGTYTNEQGQFLLETEEKDIELIGANVRGLTGFPQN